MATKIKSLEELKQLASEENGMLDCYIDLGGIRSSKGVLWVKETQQFFINNEIDDTEQELTEAEMMDDKITHIGQAIINGNFYAY